MLLLVHLLSHAVFIQSRNASSLSVAGPLLVFSRLITRCSCFQLFHSTIIWMSRTAACREGPAVAEQCAGHYVVKVFHPLKGRGNYIATSNNMKLVHWPLMGRLLHLVQRGGDWAGP